MLPLLKHSHRRVAQRLWPYLLAIVSLVCSSALCGYVCAEFDTIINSPPAKFADYGIIESNTQVNLYPGGVLPARYDIGSVWQPADNIEINLLGGSIGDEQDSYIALRTSNWRARATNVTVNLIDGNVWGDIEGVAGALVTLGEANVRGSVVLDEGSLTIVTGGRITDELSARNGSSVHMSSGSVGSGRSVYNSGAAAYEGSVFLMSGGDINGELVVSDSYANLTGGRVTGTLAVNSSGQVDIAGGSLGPLHVYSGGSATLTGGEFQLDGVPIENLGASSHSVQFPDESVLTGVLRDGTPVILANMGSLQDYLADDQIKLRLAPVAASHPQDFDAATDPVPAGLRIGQSLTLHPGTRAPANFTALPGSTVLIVGGEMRHGFEAAGASVTMSGGSIGELSTIYRGTTLHVSGGDVGSNFEAASGSRLEVSGGTIGWVFVAHPGSEVFYSGGKFAGSFTVKPSSSFTIAGGDFKLDGAPIAALATPGTEQQIDLPEYGVLSGTLSDGTPFAFPSDYQWFAPGTLTLRATDISDAGPSVIRVPSDPAPPGLRSGQTLLLGDGGDVGDYFTADWGSIVRMSGGRIGHRFQAVGSFVNVTGGEIDSINALFGSVVNIDGGSVNHHVSAGRGAIINLSGGEIASTVYASNGGRVNVTGGSLSGYAYVSNGSSLNISGGAVTGDISLYDASALSLLGGETHGGIWAGMGSRLNIHGGRLADGLFVTEGSVATLSGSSFRVDGEPIGDDSLNWVTPVDLPPGAVLSGVLTDGTPFAFTSSDGDYFAPGTLHLSPPRYFLLPRGIRSGLLGAPSPKGLRPGEELTLETGQNVGANFTAGWESALTVDGGAIGKNFEAVGAHVTLLEGSIGEDMDVLFGSEFSVRGGTVGEGLQAHQGSVVKISGGTVPEIRADFGSIVDISGGMVGEVSAAGSNVNVTGGIFGEYFEGEYRSGRITLEPGSQLHVTGTEFLLNGSPVEGLEEGSSMVLVLDKPPYHFFSLDARLLDGSPFAAYIEASLIPIDWQLDEPATITLTLAPMNGVIPEPSSLALVMLIVFSCATSRMNSVSARRKC
jgi:hypothetical protein